MRKRKHSRGKIQREQPTRPPNQSCSSTLLLLMKILYNFCITTMSCLRRTKMSKRQVTEKGYIVLSLRAARAGPV